MRSVLLTLLYYLVMSESMKELDELMGRKKLSKYIKLFHLTLLLEAFLMSPILTKDEVDAAEIFIPKLWEISVNVLPRNKPTKCN